MTWDRKSQVIHCHDTVGGLISVAEKQFTLIYSKSIDLSLIYSSNIFNLLFVADALA